MRHPHDDAARRAQRESDLQPEPTWERYGYAIAVSALWGISAGCTLGVLQYLFGG